MISVGGGSFSVGYGMQATIDKIIFEIDTRSARIHGGNPNAATILDVNTFVLNKSSLYVESYWDFKPAVAAIRYLEDEQQNVINGDGNIGVGANAMLGLGEGATLNWLYNQVRTYTGYDPPTQNGVQSVLALTQPLQLQNGVMTTVNDELVYRQSHIIIDGKKYTQELPFWASASTEVSSLKAAR